MKECITCHLVAPLKHFQGKYRLVAECEDCREIREKKRIIRWERNHAHTSQPQ